MSGSKEKRGAAMMMDNLFGMSIDTDTPAARQALKKGVLDAKEAALGKARFYAQVGLPLLVGIVFTSFVHLLDTLGAVAPTAVPHLVLPAWAHYASTFFQVAMIDLCALFLVAARGVTSYAGDTTTAQFSRFYFLVTTALLNGVYLVSYWPGMASQVTAALPMVKAVALALLVVMIPVAITSVELARQSIEKAELVLLSHIAVLRAEVTSHSTAATTIAAVPQHKVTSHSSEAQDSQHSVTGPTTLLTEFTAQTPVITAARTAAQPVFTGHSTAQHKEAVPVTSSQAVVTATHKCPHCGTVLKSAQSQGAAVRNGYCSQCKAV